MTGSDLLPVALVGMGKMGRAIDSLAADHGCRIVARLGRTEMQALTSESLGGAHVAIEFSTPEAALANVKLLLAAKCPVVIGTTGWMQQIDTLSDQVTKTETSALWAPNFSIGVNLFLGIIEDAAKRLQGIDQFDTAVVETHHSAKKDAPSGTGLAIAGRLESTLGKPVPVSSVRVGSVPGTHEVIFDSAFEQIGLRHEARDRRVFAHGALVAAKWLAAQSRPAVYTMRDVLQVASSFSGGQT